MRSQPFFICFCTVAKTPLRGQTTAVLLNVPKCLWACGESFFPPTYTGEEFHASRRNIQSADEVKGEERATALTTKKQVHVQLLCFKLQKEQQDIGSHSSCCSCCSTPPLTWTIHFAEWQSSQSKKKTALCMESWLSHKALWCSCTLTGRQSRWQRPERVPNVGQLSAVRLWLRVKKRRGEMSWVRGI